MKNSNMSKKICIFHLFIPLMQSLSCTVLKNVENKFLSKSLEKLLEPVQSMFDRENHLPSQDQIDTLIRKISR